MDLNMINTRYGTSCMPDQYYYQNNLQYMNIDPVLQYIDYKLNYKLSNQMRQVLSKLGSFYYIKHIVSQFHYRNILLDRRSYFQIVLDYPPNYRKYNHSKGRSNIVHKNNDKFLLFLGKEIRKKQIKKYIKFLIPHKALSLS